MIDPIDAHLFFILQQTNSVTADDLCWWDYERAIRSMVQARMVRATGDQWTTTRATAEWMTNLWDEIRGKVRPAGRPMTEIA